jgi:hypoxanthine phosphoribosyltransferase
MLENRVLVSKLLFSEAQIGERVAELAAQISNDYQGKAVDVICLVNSASIFCADLVRKLTLPSRVHFMSFASYPQGNATGEVRITLDIAEPLYGRDVIVVEGIVVSGRTPQYVLDVLKLRQPSSLTLCALGRKSAQSVVDLPLKYVAFELGDEIAVGYGVGSGSEKALPHLVGISQ